MMFARLQDDLEEAIEAAADPCRKGASTAVVRFRSQLRAFLAEVSDDLTVHELREALQDGPASADRDPERRG